MQGFETAGVLAMKALKVSLAALLWMAAVGAQGEVKLPKVLADHMVLQRGVPIHLGWPIQ